LLAAASPGASCPAVLHSMLAALLDGRQNLDLMVDLGAGVGGISEWFRRRTGAAMIAIEPAPGARDAARSLFPALSVRSGSAESSGLPGAIADAVVVSGVLSLIDDAGAVLTEAARIARPGGAIAIGDLFAAGSAPLQSRPNMFRTLQEVADLLEDRGWNLVEIGVGTPPPDRSWAAAGALVDDWIRRHRRDHAGFADWVADQEHLRRHIEHGDLVAGCVVARHSGQSRHSRCSR
jgi:SAM-dependent methyltransferase